LALNKSTTTDLSLAAVKVKATVVPEVAQFSDIVPDNPRSQFKPFLAQEVAPEVSWWARFQPYAGTFLWYGAGCAVIAGTGCLTGAFSLFLNAMKF
jgi:hypothetical protein